MQRQSFVRCSAVIIPLTVALAALVAGCRKHPAPPANPPTAEQPGNVSANSNEPAAPTAEAPALPTANAESSATKAPPPLNLDQLTLKLHHWIGAKQRLPRDFEEFAADNPNQIPPPPAGKKYALDRSTMRVILVDR